MFQVPACQGIGLEFMEKDCGPTSRKHNLETTIGGPPVPQFARWHVAKDIGAAFKKSAIGLRISAIAVKHHLIQILPGSWTWPPEILPSNQKSTVQVPCWTSRGGMFLLIDTNYISYWSFSGLKPARDHSQNETWKMIGLGGLSGLNASFGGTWVVQDVFAF